MNFSLHDFPTASKIKHKRRLKFPLKEDPREDDSSSRSESIVLEDPELRQTLFESVVVRMSEKQPYTSPYQVRWSVENLPIVVNDPSGSQISTAPNSMETFGYVSDDLFVNPAKSQNTELLEPLEEAKSPYQKFFERSTKDLREHVDRLRKKKFHSLSEKCIEDFIKFLDDNDIRSPKITSETLNKLFTIEIGTPAEKAFCLDPHELPSVPNEIAELYNEPHSSKRAALHQQIMWDIIYEKGKEKRLAFGSLLPKVRKPWNKNTKEQWFQPPNLDWDFVTGKDLWKDLMHTEILEEFGKWLLEHPVYPKPDYLERVGFFDYLKGKAEADAETVKLPASSEEHFCAIMRKINRPLYVDFDEERFTKLPRYGELKQQAFSRYVGRKKYFSAMQ